MMAISDTELGMRQPNLSLRERAALAAAPRRKPERRPWDLAAKYARAEQIGREELLISRLSALAQKLPDSHNNALDARRHARWSQRMSSEIDPVTSFVAGAGHELAGVLYGQPWAETLMDSRNNAEGRLAAREGRAIDPRNLQRRLSDRQSTGRGARISLA